MLSGAPTPPTPPTPPSWLLSPHYYRQQVFLIWRVYQEVSVLMGSSVTHHWPPKRCVCACVCVCVFAQKHTRRSALFVSAFIWGAGCWANCINTHTHTSSKVMFIYSAWNIQELQSLCVFIEKEEHRWKLKEWDTENLQPTVLFLITSLADYFSSSYFFLKNVKQSMTQRCLIQKKIQSNHLRSWSQRFLAWF